MSGARTLIRVPASARAGEVIEIQAAIAHPMETGHRPGPDGKVLPRNIVRRFSCRYDGATVFEAELFPAIAANPYLSFTTVATRSGELRFAWEGDEGFAHVETRMLRVDG
ncbi:MAG: thiosulfate oxidation carrier complex protein SoxZ [Lautropia sp.]